MVTVDIINSAIPLHTMFPGFFFACSGSGMADGLLCFTLLRYLVMMHWIRKLKI